MSEATPTRPIVLPIASAVLPGLSLFCAVSAWGAEPIYGEPSLGAMVVWVGVPCVLIPASLIAAGVAVVAAARRSLWLLATFPLALGIWFAVESMLVYSGDQQAQFRELAEGYVQPEDRRQANQPAVR